jgi:hypothetical protein
MTPVSGSVKVGGPTVEVAMDQADGAGHHAVTREAVRELFASGRADASGRIDGMSEEEYFQALDRAQEHQDRWYGPTTHPAWMDGDAQRQHGMADPDHDGAWNLATNRQYVEGELAAAHEGGRGELQHLGNAAHALEDSYSEAHAWRGDAANHGDPNAPVESFNVFNPLPSPGMHTGGIFGLEGTHDHHFDHVPVDEHGHLVHGTDQAAAHATAQMLESYHDHRGEPAAQAATGVHETVQHFYQPGEHGVAVNNEYTEAWAAERDQRLHEHEREEREHVHAGDTSLGHCAGECHECGTQYSMSSGCAQPAGHGEEHTCAYGHSWH